MRFLVVILSDVEGFANGESLENEEKRLEGGGKSVFGERNVVLLVDV